jgi:hypothetical protein
LLLDLYNEDRLKTLLKYSIHTKLKKMIKILILIELFHKANKIICMYRIKKFLLKYIILRPNSKYIYRLASEFN